MQALAELPFVAGNSALDFCNTAEERGHPLAGDVLHTPADLRLWGRRYGLIDSSAETGSAAAAEFSTTIEARELLYEVFLATSRGESPSAAQLARLADLAAVAYAAGRLHERDDKGIRWQWSRSRLATIRHIAVTSAVELLGVDPAPRLKQCPGDHCGWFFLDTTKRGNRRWCLMSECGQDAKDRRRRQRAKTAASPPLRASAMRSVATVRDRSRGEKPEGVRREGR